MYKGILVCVFVMAVVVILIFFLRLMWEFLGLESERRDFVCWTNNKITRRIARAFAQLVLKI